MATKVKVSYEWKSSWNSWKCDPQVAGQTLEDLAERNGGLTPLAIVEEARPKKSPLHDDFEWDDSIAAEEWRKQTARHMANNLVVVESHGNEEKPTKTTAFVSIKSNGDRHYVPIAQVVSDEDMYLQAVQQCIDGIAWYRNKLSRFRDFSKFASLFDHLVETLQEEIE